MRAGGITLAINRGSGAVRVTRRMLHLQCAPIVCLLRLTECEHLSRLASGISFAGVTLLMQTQQKRDGPVFLHGDEESGDKKKLVILLSISCPWLLAIRWTLDFRSLFFHRSL